MQNEDKIQKVLQMIEKSHYHIALYLRSMRAAFRAIKIFSFCGHSSCRKCVGTYNEFARVVMEARMYAYPFTLKSRLLVKILFLTGESVASTFTNVP